MYIEQFEFCSHASKTVSEDLHCIRMIGLVFIGSAMI